jgi:hypothetical protein
VGEEAKKSLENDFMLTTNARIAIESDIDGIIKLQSLNLYTNLSEAERTEGFVTTPFTAEQIETLLIQTGVFVAQRQEKVAGYIFAGSWDFFSQWAIFPYMVSRFPQIRYQGTQITVNNTFQYGPVCIDRTLRGSETFPQLFKIMRSHFASRFPIGITFINKANPRSLAAHTQKLNLEVIDEFEFNGNFYYTLGFWTKD